MRPTNRFTRGTGCYTCRACGRKTRDTGRGDNEGVRLCAECYDLAGIENALMDAGSTFQQELDRYRNEAKCLLDTIRKLGGKPRFMFEGQL